MKATVNEIITALEKAQKIVVFCHVRPDGDAIGSGLALCLALKNLGKTAYMCCEEFTAEKFSFLPATAAVLSEVPNEEYDTLVCVDCAEVSRIGSFAKRFAKFNGVTVNIDHHVSNSNFANFDYVCECPATAEIITEIFRTAKWEINEEIANLLMLGLITDSGNFIHRDVTAKTYETAAYLRTNGADCTKINYEMYTRQTKARALLFGKVMNGIRFALDDKLAFVIVSAQDMLACGADKSATEGFVDFPLTVDGVEVSVALLEFKKEQYKVSFRSKGKVNVNAIATSFGGGGHVLASGCMLCGSVEHVIDKLSYAVYQNL